MADAILLLHSSLARLRELIDEIQPGPQATSEDSTASLLDIAQQIEHVRGTVVRELMTHSLEIAIGELRNLQARLTGVRLRGYPQHAAPRPSRKPPEPY